MVLVPMLARMMARGESVAAEGWSICFGVLGAILAVFGGLIAVTWPLNAKTAGEHHVRGAHASSACCCWLLPCICGVMPGTSGSSTTTGGGLC